MNTKKIVAMGIALIMTSGMLVGCGNSVDHKDSEVSSTVETTIDKDVDKTAEEESDEKSKTADKADKEDSKETSNKAEKPNDNKVADKSDKDKGSANNSNSSVSKPSNSGNANNNGSASKPNTPAKPNKPSSGNNSGSSNNGNHNGSVNKPSKPAEKPSEKPSESQKPAPHVCNFNIWKDEVSHTEMVTETYTEQVPKYKWVGYHECRKCGFQTEDDDAIALHIFDCDSTYTTLEKQVQDGFETVTKTRQVPKTVVDDPAHYECSCGKRK